MNIQTPGLKTVRRVGLWIYTAVVLVFMLAGPLLYGWRGLILVGAVIGAFAVATYGVHRERREDQLRAPVAKAVEMGWQVEGRSWAGRFRTWPRVHMRKDGADFTVKFKDET